MDVDLDLEYQDRISDFLRSKLKKIKNENAQLEEALETREEVLKNLREEIARNNSDNSVEFGEIWKKIVNGKYVLGLEMKNNSQSALENIKVILSWTSSSHLTYKFHLVSLYPTLLDKLKSVPFAQSARIILVFDIPFFTDRLSYTVSGSVAFLQDQNKQTLKFPKSIQLFPQDVVDNSIIVHLYKVIEGNSDHLLALALSSQKHEFVLVLPDSLTRLLESTLEIDCALNRIDLKTNRKLFLAHKISGELDGALLEVGDDAGQVVQVKIYCQNLETVVALLHHLHRHIIGVVIVPKNPYRPDLSSSEVTDLLKASLLKELEELERSDGDLNGLKDRITNLEIETDLLVSRVNQKLDS